VQEIRGISLVFREMWDSTVLNAQRDRCHPEQPVIFSMDIRPVLSQAPHKAVILSEALRGSIANRELCGAQSKDPGDACWQMLLEAFRPRTTKAAISTGNPSEADGSDPNQHPLIGYATPSPSTKRLKIRSTLGMMTPQSTFR
jgi:hypothetical protein